MIKLQATGVHAAVRLRCHARAIGQGAAVNPACLAATNIRLVNAFARAERKTGCPPTLLSVQAQSEAFVATLLASAEPTPGRE